MEEEAGTMEEDGFETYLPNVSFSSFLSSVLFFSFFLLFVASTFLRLQTKD